MCTSYTLALLTVYVEIARDISCCTANQTQLKIYVQNSVIVCGN